MHRSLRLKAIFLLLALVGLTGLGSLVIRQDLASAAWQTVGSLREGVDDTVILTAGPALLPELLAAPDQALAAVAAQLPDGEAADALRMVLADLQSVQQIFVKRAAAVTVQQEAVATLVREAHTLWQRQQDLGVDLLAAAQLSGTVPVEQAQGLTKALVTARQALQVIAAQADIALNLTLPVAVPATISRYVCCGSDADCGACFDLGDADGDNQVAPAVCGACQRYSGLGQQYDIAIVDLVVMDATFHAVLRNHSTNAAAPVHLDFYWDDQLLPEASFQQILVAPGQKFDTAALRPLALPTSPAGKHLLTAKLVHPKGQDLNAANDSWTRVVSIPVRQAATSK